MRQGDNECEKMWFEEIRLTVKCGVQIETVDGENVAERTPSSTQYETQRVKGKEKEHSSFLKGRLLYPRITLEYSYVSILYHIRQTNCFTTQTLQSESTLV